MRNKQWIIIALILTVILIGISVKKSTTECIESDRGDIWIKGTCYDGNAYEDTCRIDDGNELIEVTCSRIGCISQIINCDNYDAYCNGGKCIRR